MGEVTKGEGDRVGATAKYCAKAVVDDECDLKLRSLIAIASLAASTSGPFNAPCVQSRALALDTAKETRFDFSLLSRTLTFLL